MGAVVVSVGARTPIGLSAEQTALLYRAGFPAMASAPLADERGEPVIMCSLRTLDPRLTGAARVAWLAAPALDEALRGLGGAGRGLTAELCLTVDEHLDEAEASAIAGSLRHAARAHGMELSAPLTARGEAGAAVALGPKLAALLERRLDVLIWGGAHSDHDPAVIARLARSGLLFAPDNLDARIPGEAAAFAVLVRPETARQSRLAAMAEIAGVGTGMERARPDNDASAWEAQGLPAALREAASGLGSERRAGWLLTDLTFEMRRIQEWQAVMIRARRLLCEPFAVDSPAQRVGYLGAAALPLAVVLAAEAWAGGYAPAPVALAFAGSDSGARGALSLAQPGP